MSRVETVAESWESYRHEVLPANAGPAQIAETRRAFYAGSYITLMNIATHVGDPNADEEEGVENLERLKAECEAFAASVALEGKHAASPMPADIHYTLPDPLDIQAKMKHLGRLIGDGLPDGWGFNLLLFTYGEGGSLFYISSAERADVLNVMREFIKRQTQ